MILHSAATVLAAYLRAMGIFSDPAANRIWPLFANSMPDQPAQLGVVFTTVGFMDGRIQPTGRTVEHPGFMVELRTPLNTLADAKGSEVIQALDQINRTVVIVESKSYIVHAMKRTTPLIPIGQEEGGGRLLFTLNGTLTYGEL